jgi:hypothetical protein
MALAICSIMLLAGDEVRAMVDFFQLLSAAPDPGYLCWSAIWQIPVYRDQITGH